MFSRISTEYGEKLRVSLYLPKAGKYRPEKTKHLDTFQAVNETTILLQKATQVYYKLRYGFY